MNTTNSDAVLLAAQQIAAQHGYQLSGTEVSALMALGGALVHLLHQIVNAGGIKPVFSMLWDNTKPMKNILLIGIAVLGLAMMTMMNSGCKTSPQTLAYQAAGTVVTSVPVAMSAWDVWVQQGKATPAQELSVKAAYEKYQAAMEVACDAGAIYAATSVTNATAGQQLQLAESAAIANASQSIADLENLIHSFGVSF